MQTAESEQSPARLAEAFFPFRSGRVVMAFAELASLSSQCGVCGGVVHMLLSCACERLAAGSQSTACVASAFVKIPLGQKSMAYSQQPVLV